MAKKELKTGDWVKVKRNTDDDVDWPWTGEIGIVARVDHGDDNIGLPYEVVLPRQRLGGKQKICAIWFRRDELKRLGTY